MKVLFVLVLTFITFAGTFVPCCEVDNCIAEQTASEKDHDEDTAEGMCSPFNSCSSCTPSVEISKGLEITQPFIERLVHYDRFTAFNHSHYNNSCWQPPRSC